MGDKAAREKASAKEVLDRSEREIRHLTELGVDVAALAERFEAAKKLFGEENWGSVQRACGEVLVLAKSMQAITAASLKSGRSRNEGDKISETMRMELSRLVASEVSSRVEAVARTLPTSSSVEELVVTKIQEALVTGGLIERLESVASDKAQAAIAGIPRFTAKDAQAAANLVVQRSLTQFLSSRELGTRIGAAVENALTKALGEAEERINKSVETLLNSRIASATSQLPTNDTVTESIEKALGRFLKEEPLEEKILTLAAERAKVEVGRAPDVMTEAAARIAREEADALIKTHTRSQEFVEQIKQLARTSADEIIASVPRLEQEDVEVIARRVADESLASLAESDILREKIEGQAKETVEGVLSTAGFDDKARAIAQEVVDAAPRVSPEQFEEALGGLKTTIDEKLGESMDERQKAVDEKLADAAAKVEELLTARPAEDKFDEVFAKVDEKLADAAAKTEEQLSTRPTKEKLAEVFAKVEEQLTDSATKVEELLTTRPTKEELTDAVIQVRTDLMTNEDFASWIKDGALEAIKEAGLSGDVKDITKKIITKDRVERIARHEALTASMDLLEKKEFVKRIAEVLAEKPVRQKLEELAGGAGPKDLEETVGLQAKNVFVELLDGDEFAGKVKELAGNSDEAEKAAAQIDEKVGKLQAALPALVEKTLTAKLDPKAMKEQMSKIAESSISDIANTPVFKEMLETKFKAIMTYLTQDVIPKQIRRMMGGG
jgi:hypothetical protein